MKIAVVTVCKNEELYLDEWITYHLGIGVDHIFLYDNNTSENQYRTDNANVSVERFELRQEGFLASQTALFRSVYQSLSPDYDWIAFIDVDEFISVPDGNLKSFLETYGDADTIHLRWQCYGDNNLLLYEPGNVQDRFTSLVIPNSMYLSRPANLYVKSIVRTNRPLHMINHHTAIVGKGVCYNGDGSLGNAADEYTTSSYSGAYLKHYVTKSLEEYFLRRCLLQCSVFGTKYKNPLERMNDYFSMNTYTSTKMYVLNKLCDTYGIKERFTLGAPANYPFRY